MGSKNSLLEILIKIGEPVNRFLVICFSKIHYFFSYNLLTFLSIYKKTKHLPGKGDLQKQYAFVKVYNQLKSNLGKHDEVYFMDGVHPLHNSINCNGWIKKGTEKAIKSNTGRDRLNMNGACNIAKTEVIIHEDVSVNAQSTIALFDKILIHQPKGMIHIYSR